MKKVRCYLGLHAWVKHVQAGEVWFECRDCGKYGEQAAAIFGRRGRSG